MSPIVSAARTPDEIIGVGTAQRSLQAGLLERGYQVRCPKSSERRLAGVLGVNRRFEREHRAQILCRIQLVFAFAGDKVRILESILEEAEKARLCAVIADIARLVRSGRAPQLRPQFVGIIAFNRSGNLSLRNHDADIGIALLENPQPDIAEWLLADGLHRHDFSSNRFAPSNHRPDGRVAICSASMTNAVRG